MGQFGRIKRSECPNLPSGKAVRLSMGNDGAWRFPQRPFLFNLGYESRNYFLVVAARMSTDFQAERLEPRNSSLTNGVRAFPNLLRPTEGGCQILECQAKLCKTLPGDLLLAYFLIISFELRSLFSMALLIPGISQNAGRCISSLRSRRRSTYRCVGW